MLHLYNEAVLDGRQEARQTGRASGRGADIALKNALLFYKEIENERME
jgi:hypothetical protein